MSFWEKKRLEVFKKTGSVRTKYGTSTVFASPRHWNQATLERIIFDAARWEESYGFLGEVDAYYLSFGDTMEDFKAALEALEKELLWE